MRLILEPIALQFFKRVKEGRETYHRTHYTKHLFIIIKQWNMAQIICKEKLYYIYNLIKSHNYPSNLKWIENKIEFNCDRSLLFNNLSMNLNSRFTIWGNREISEWQFPYFLDFEWKISKFLRHFTWNH